MTFRAIAINAVATTNFQGITSVLMYITIFVFVICYFSNFFPTMLFAATVSGLEPEHLTDTVFGYWVIAVFVVAYSLVDY